MDEELAYVSSSPLVETAKPKVKAQDEQDISTLKKVSKLLQDEIDAYKTVDRLTTDEGKFTVTQQLAMNQAMITEISRIKLEVDTAINNVREKYDGR